MKEDLVDKRFGRLVVLKFVGMNKHRQSLWLCRCDCTKEKVIRQLSLRNGDTQSCGCFRKDRTRSMSFKHGLKKEPLYNIWVGIRNRCNNPNDISYKNYGGRGIKVDARWDDPQVFYMDLIDLFEEALRTVTGRITIDRRENDKGYVPGNIRFVNDLTQAQNKRDCQFFTYDGETKTLPDWCRHFGLSAKAVNQRIKKGWSFEEAMFIEFGSDEAYWLHRKRGL